MEEKYKKKFLTNVIFRLDYNPILKIEEDSPAAFQEEIRKDSYSIYNKEIDKISIIIDSNKSEVPLIEQSKIRHVFNDNDKTKKITLTNNFLSLEYKKYKHFKSEFLPDINKIISTFDKIYKPNNYISLGLRYINQIKLNKGNPFDWEGLVHNSLIYEIYNFIDNKDKIIRAFKELIIKKDTHKIVFHYGIYNPDYPNMIAKKEFILDFDGRIDDEIHLCDIEKHLITINEDITALFEKSIGEKLKKIMLEGSE
jgi:uncharacterized protein (TIGR04255 family)